MNLLWIIEKVNPCQGGPIKWYEEFRLKNF